MDKFDDTETGDGEKEKVPLTGQKADDNNVQKMTLISKIKYVYSITTVEPVLMIFITASVLAALATQNLNLEKACRVNLNYSDVVCTALKQRRKQNFTSQEQAVQSIIAETTAWKNVIKATVPTILMMFIGAWSDKTGKRKICILMPIFGEFMSSILTLLCAYFFYEVTVEVTVFLEVIFLALTGGWNTMFLGVFSYLGDITSRETRTFRFGILSFGMTVGFPVGMALSGVLLKLVGYYGVFAISATLKLMTFFYVLFHLDDHTWLRKNEKAEGSGVSAFLREFFDYRSLRQTVMIALKSGANNRRLKILLILTVVALNFIPITGEQSVMYIFTRYKFNWSAVSYSIYQTFHLVTHSIGTIFSISVFSKRLGMDDAALGMLSTASKIGAAAVLVIARTNYELYLSPFAEILNGTTPVALRSIASKLVSHQDLGKVYSLFGIVEALVPLVAGPLYSWVYMATLAQMPGAVFLISVVVMIPAFVIFSWFFYDHKMEARKVLLAAKSRNIADDEDVEK